ncbi:MAG: sensor histidine kinase, partial [Nostoc sp.]
VYLTQELVETPSGEAKLIPVVIYPETALLPPGEETAEATVHKQLQVGNVFVLPHTQRRLLTPRSESPTSSRESEIPDA